MSRDAQYDSYITTGRAMFCLTEAKKSHSEAAGCTVHSNEKIWELDQAGALVILN